MTEINSKHATVSKSPAELYMAFTDMRNFLQFIPEDRKAGVTADFDSISTEVQGFHVGVKVESREPFSRILFADNGAPFRFNAALHFDEVAGEPSKTDFHIDFSAELNLMMKMLLGSKLKDAMDRIVDGLAVASEGRMPEGVDQSTIDEIKKKYGL